MFMAHVGSPILSHTLDLEDCFLAGGIVVIDALGPKFINDAGAKSQSVNREVVKVPVESAVLETQDHSSEILSARKTYRKRYLVVPPIECKLSPTLPQTLDSYLVLDILF